MGSSPGGDAGWSGEARQTHVRCMGHLSFTISTVPPGDARRRLGRTPTWRFGRSRRNGKRIRLGRVAVHLVVNSCLLIAASGVGHALARPAHHESTEAERAVESLITGYADPTVVPADFDAVLGYRPQAQSGTLARADGSCSTPFGIGPSSFEPACRTHDLGYDLLRYAEKTDGRLAAWARLRLDLRLYTDLRGTCADPRCRATAALYLVSLTGNSVRQGFTAPTSEPTSPWAAAGIGVLVFSVFTAHRNRGVRLRAASRAKASADR